MKKKILLILLMFTFITNVNALTFNVDVTNIENEGNNGTIGSITNIDVPNKTVDAYFQDIGDEVNFSITVTNTGDRAGTLRSIDFEPGNDKIEYSSDLPDGGLAINGNDTNKVIVKAKVKPGAQNGKTTSEVKIKYTYDEGSCPDGEILSEDESMCLCPEGMERNETGICVKPEKPVECKDDEIYNETKKICEKKVVPVTPSNPKTMDNIILVTLLFVVSGLGIYAVMFRKLNTKKKKVTAGIITGVATLSLSFTVLAGVFGLGNLLGAIINPITKSKELVVTVNEEIDLIETWDGDCDVTGTLTPSNVFDGGSGTESDPYKIKTANQLACFAKSINAGETYEGKFIKQTKNIKLNDNLNDQVTAGDLSGANVWLAAGVAINTYDYDNASNPHFSGTYDGDNKVISGLYITDASAPATIVDAYDYTRYSYNGMFGHTINATFKNMILSDVYMNTNRATGGLIGYANSNLTIDNVATYGEGIITDYNYGAGIVSMFDGNNIGSLSIENSTNNINMTCFGSCSGVIHRMENVVGSDDPTIVLRNNIGNGNLTFNNPDSSPYGSAPLYGTVDYSDNTYILIDNSVSNGNFTLTGRHRTSYVGGIIGEVDAKKIDITNSSNTGDWEGLDWCGPCGTIIGHAYASEGLTIDTCYNSGNVTPVESFANAGNTYDYFGGLAGEINGSITVRNSFNTGDFEVNSAYMAGIVSKSGSGIIENVYNTGNVTGYGYVGGIYGIGSATITKSYNTGTITAFEGPITGGLVGWSAPEINNSYNAGTVINNGGGLTGGLVGYDCDLIKNSYNRGDIIANNSATDIGGISGYHAGTVENVYNSGNVIYTNEKRYGNGGYVAGITPSGGPVSNCYNIGNVTFHAISSTTGAHPNPHIDGISTYGSPTNCVNTGIIKLVVDESLIDQHEIDMNGIAYNGATNCFNAGKIEIDDSAVTPKIREDGVEHKIKIGQISERANGTGNKWNTDPNGFAIGCMTLANPSSSCTLEASLGVGTYSDEATPDILSIINGDGAFNDELDEDGLPTLKVFNN